MAGIHHCTIICYSINDHIFVDIAIKKSASGVIGVHSRIHIYSDIRSSMYSDNNKPRIRTHLEIIEPV